MAVVQAVALVASARCPDILVNTDVNQLGGALSLTDLDGAAVFAQTQSFTKDFNDQVDKAGANAWCDDVYARFGPAGTTMRGLLRR